MIFEAQGISKAFGPTQALAGASLRLEAGEVHALAGENGSGKSTFMRILNGELVPDSGSMRLSGQEYAPRNPREALAAGVTLIHQELAISDHLTIAENVFLGAEVGRSGWANRKEMADRAAACLAQLGRPDLAPHRLAKTLSPAEKQLVEVARALRSKAKVILFDEPTSSLGRSDVQALFEQLRRLKSEGIALVYITHFLDEIAETCDRCTVLRDGELVGTFPVAETSSREIASHMAGRELDMVFPTRVSEPGEEVLSGEQVKLRRGEVVGLAGLNGAGRTETARRLFGLDPGARIAFFGHEVQPTPKALWDSGAGFVSEDRKTEGLALNLTLEENLTLPRVGRTWRSPNQLIQRTNQVIDRFGVKCAGPNQRISALSGGNQQKIALGRLLDTDAQILILDEPTRGIDVRSKGEIYAWIAERATEGRAILLISSQLSELVGLCDRILVLRRGAVVAEVKACETSEQELLELGAGA